MSRIAIFNSESKRIACVKQGKAMAKCFYYDTSDGHAAAQSRAEKLNSEAGRNLYEIHPCTAQQLADGKL